MPQDVRFFLPFARRVNPLAERARAHHLGWVRAHGLVAEGPALRAYADWRLTDLAAYAYPEANAEDIELATDAVCLGFPLDDQFDGELGRSPSSAFRLSTALAGIPYRPPGERPALDLPLTRAYADMWRRASAGMSDAWRRRAADNLTRFFRSYVGEARNRLSGAPLDENAYLSLRRQAVGTAPCFDLIERAGRFEVPARAYWSRELQILTRCAGDVIFLCNDVHSLEREEAQGDPHNLVLIRQRAQGCTRAQAVRQVTALVRGRVEMFIELSGRVPRIAARLGLDTAGRVAVERYLEGLRCWMAGNQRWGVASARYTGGAAGRGVIGDLTVPGPASGPASPPSGEVSGPVVPVGALPAPAPSIGPTARVAPPRATVAH
ncbi:terpene cyclase [Streptomyces sp. NBRC 109706]|uniref:terpene synthase family protein n=1 Tax=Streptomyces sp. NBRC 109706 TaxID=1550035 RepID=UPI00131D1EEF|nr:terpene cyclase [Streptomyces sp. NBRC 109706]